MGASSDASREAAAVLRDWLENAATVVTAPEGEDRTARRLDTVAEIIGMRRDGRR
jgi:hypothetical protein